MRELGARKKSEFCERFIGRNVAVLLEDKIDHRTRLRCGFTTNYLPVAVKADDVNAEVSVRLGGYGNGWLRGEVDPPQSAGHHAQPDRFTASAS